MAVHHMEGCLYLPQCFLSYLLKVKQSKPPFPLVSLPAAVCILHCSAPVFRYINEFHRERLGITKENSLKVCY